MNLNELAGTLREIGVRAEDFKKAQEGRFDQLADRLDRLEARAANPLRGGGFGSDGIGLTRLESEEVKRFEKGLRDHRAWLQLDLKAVDADFASNSTAGGVAVPEVIASEILMRVKNLSDMRRLVRSSRVGSPNYERLVDVKGTASGWAGESDTRSETGTATIQRVTFTHGELFAVPKASQWALNDIQFDVVNWLIESIAEEFAFQEGAAVISGNGTNKPTGFLNGTPVATGDTDSPARAFGVLQYFPTGVAGAFPGDRLASPPGDPVAPLLDTLYGLRPGYRQNSTWLMNSNTARVISGWRDADGRQIWQQGLTEGQPPLLLGRPVVTMEDMPSIGSNTFPVALGDWRRGYELIDIGNLILVRDDVTVKGFVLFYVARRLGGKVTDDHAIKLIKAAAS